MLAVGATSAAARRAAGVCIRTHHLAKVRQLLGGESLVEGQQLGQRARAWAGAGGEVARQARAELAEQQLELA
jgi:hypothetical protein